MWLYHKFMMSYGWVPGEPELAFTNVLVELVPGPKMDSLQSWNYLCCPLSAKHCIYAYIYRSGG